MDVDRATERLLWLEAEALTLAAESRRLRRQLRTVRLVEADAFTREVAALSVVVEARADEVRLWRSVAAPTPPRRWWWPW